jgi:hypothetical protein
MQMQVQVLETAAGGEAGARCTRGPVSARGRRGTLRGMYVIDLWHFLDAKGAIAPERGPARRMADFITAVVSHASDYDRSDDAPGPLCFKCRVRDRRPVETSISSDDLVVWQCLACGTSGQVDHWQGSFWDLSRGLQAD